MLPRYIFLLLLASQTLGDAARREAERRKALADQGVPDKVIEYAGTPADVPKETRRGTKPAAKAPQHAARGNDRFRTAFQKLDREARAIKDRLDVLRRQLDREKSNSRRSSSRGAAAAEEKLERQIDELELKRKRLESERLDAYNSARKAGMLPGEIDGKGVTP